jgi:hypothetical protein
MSRYDQYNPVGTAEVAADAALSVRAVRDLADGINNAAYYVLNHKVISQYWPDRISSGDSTADETVVVVFPPVYVPRLYNTCTWHCTGARTSGEDNITVKLICTDRLYKGAAATGGTISSALIGANAKTSTVTINSSSVLIYRNTCSLIRSGGSMCWFILTMTNDTTYDAGYVNSIDITPRVT